MASHHRNASLCPSSISVKEEELAWLESELVKWEAALKKRDEDVKNREQSLEELEKEKNECLGQLLADQFWTADYWRGVAHKLQAEAMQRDTIDNVKAKAPGRDMCSRRVKRRINAILATARRARAALSNA